MVAVLFQLLFLLVVLKLSPYENSDEDISSFVSSLTVLLMTLGAVMLVIGQDSKSSDLSEFDVQFATAFMVGIPIICITFDVIMIFLATKKGQSCRKKCMAIYNKNGKQKAKAVSVIKVTPTQAPKGNPSSNAAQVSMLEEIRNRHGADSPEYKELLQKTRADVEQVA